MLRPIRAHAWSVLPSVTLLALAVPPMVRQPLWYDEVATQDASRRSLPGLWHLLQHTDGVLAGYYLLMHLVLELGSAPWLLRLPSLGATLLTVVLVGRLGDRLLGGRGGGYAALLYAANPFVVTYAYDARPYAIATVAVTGAAVVASSPHGDRKSLRWPLLASLAVVAHLFAAFALVPQLRRSSRRSQVLLPGILLAVLVLVSVSQRGQLGWISRPAWYAPLSGWSTLCGGWWLALPAGVGLVQALRRGAPWLAVALWAVCPLVLLLLLSVVDPVYLPRYAIEACPVLAIVTMAGLQQLAVVGGRLVVAPTLAVGVGIVVAATQGLHPYRYEDLPAAADFIRDGSQQGDGLVYLGASARLALGDEIAEPGRPRSGDGPAPPDVLQAQPSDAIADGALEDESVGPHDVASSLGPPRRLWVVSWVGDHGMPSGDPTSVAAQETLREGWSSVTQHDFGSMRVTLWGRRSPRSPY